MGKRKTISICKNCNTEFHSEYSSNGYYCSNKCQIEYQYKSYISRWLEGFEKGWTSKTRVLSDYIRKYLFELKGARCEVCGWNECHSTDNKPLVEIDHIDGNAENCKLDNLKILCPNHHSMTLTFRNRNKVSKRNR